MYNTNWTLYFSKKLDIKVVILSYVEVLISTNALKLKTRYASQDHPQQWDREISYYKLQWRSGANKFQ